MDFLWASSSAYEYEYLVAVVPPGGRTKRLYRGTVYRNSADEEKAREYAIRRVSSDHGYNLNQEYTCVILPPDEDE